MTEKEKEQILHLYFNRLFSYEEIQKSFNDKFSYSEIKYVIKGRYDEYNYDGIRKSKVKEVVSKEISKIKKGK